MTAAQGGDSSTLEESEDSNVSNTNEDVGESESEPDLDDYILARDMARRENRRPPSKFEVTNFVAYALYVACE